MGLSHDISRFYILLKKKNQVKVYTLRSSRFGGSGPGLREETPVCPEMLFLTGDRGVLLSGVEEELVFLVICSFGSLKNKRCLQYKTVRPVWVELGTSHREIAYGVSE